MEITLKVTTLVFEGYDKKSVYLKGCKAVAKFCRQKYKNTNLSICPCYKGQDLTTGLHTFNFDILTSVDLEKELKNTCARCREFRSSFFLSESNLSCESCTLNSFVKRMREALNISKGAYKEKME